MSTRTLVDDLESQSYREGFAPKKVLRRSSPMNRGNYTDKNSSVLLAAAGDENKSPLEPHFTRSKKSSTPRIKENFIRSGQRKVLSESVTVHQTTLSQLHASGTEAYEATGQTLSTLGAGSEGSAALSPRRCVQRTPPAVARSASKVKGKMNEDPFTPSKTLRRTPPQSRSRVLAKNVTKEKERSVNPFVASKSLKRTPYIARPPAASSVELEEKKEMEDPFTPSKSLKRTPPLANKHLIPDMKDVKEMEDLSPSKSLRRTPTRTNTGGSTIDKKRKRALVRERGEEDGATLVKTRKLDTSLSETEGMKGVVPENAISTEILEGPVSEGEGVYDAKKRGVQASCFTPQKTLRRSLRSCPEPQTDLADAVPPTSKWEIARTPVSSKPPSRHELDYLEQHQGNASLADKDKVTPNRNNVSRTKVTRSSPRRKNGALATKKGVAVSKSPRVLPIGVDGCAEEVPLPAKFEISRTPPTSHSKISSDQDSQKSTVIPATSLRNEVPMTVPNAISAVPPTSHWEIPRTPPPQLSTSSLASVPPMANMIGGDQSGQTSAAANTPSATSPPSVSQAPSPRRTPSFELAANIVKSMATKSLAAINSSSKIGIREALESQNVASQGHFAPSSVSEDVASTTGLTPPPKAQWEIPRTPVEVVNYQSVQLSPSKQGLSRTPSRTKVPAHPLSVMASSKTETNLPPLSASESSPSSGTLEDEQLTNASPPTCVGQVALPGLQCTDEDLAFLERRKNLTRLKELQVKSDQLAKEEKSATEEKEQLEHAYMKVQGDIAAMQGSYWDVVRSLQAMVENPLLTMLPETHPPSGETAGVELPVLKQSDSEQLRKLNLQAVAQLDKLDKKLQARKEELKAAEVARQLKLSRQQEKRQALQAKISALESQKVLLDQKLCGVGSQLASVEDEVRQLQDEVARMEGSHSVAAALSVPRSAPMSAKDRQARLREKAVIEERLKILIRRCEVYCKRRRMLEDMGVIKRSRRS